MSSYLYKLPKELISEIIFACNLEDVSIFLKSIIEIYNFTKDEFIWTNYKKINTKYIYKIGVITFNFLEYFQDINYK